MTSASSHPLSALDRFGCFRSLHANFKANLKKFMLDIEVDLFFNFPNESVAQSRTQASRSLLDALLDGCQPARHVADCLHLRSPRSRLLIQQTLQTFVNGRTRE